MDFLVLFIYLLCSGYVFLRIINYIESLIIVNLNQERLTQQLQGQNLANILDLSFDFPDQSVRKSLDKIKLKISNKSENMTFYVDWQRCTITDFKLRSHRVIRIIPGMTLDLLSGQVFSVIAPGQTLKEEITTEITLKRDEKGNLIIKDPFLTPKELKKALEKNKHFFLNLCFQSQVNSDRIFLYSLSCEFSIKKMPWGRAIAWKVKPEKDE